MKKYLELFKDGFDSTITEKTEVKNWPYVGYSPDEGVVYTVIPEPVVGPANNEIWYTSSDGNVVNPSDASVFGANIVSNTYEEGKGVIKFDNNITSIGMFAFYACSSLTSIVLPNSVANIVDSAFDSCSSLTSIVIGNSVTSIGGWAFAYCSSLTSINIPESVTSIGDVPFNSCSSLPIENNLRYADTYLVEAVDKTLSTYSIKEGTKWIGQSAFYGCSSLTSTTIPNGVTSIEKQAFLDCSSLTSITIPNSVTSIRNHTFAGCSSLASVTIGNSVTSIGWSAFLNCTSLTSITFEGTIEEWRSITTDSDCWKNVPATYIQCTNGQAAR